jgi:hypothetical protein
VTVHGSGIDTMNVDDSGETRDSTPFFTGKVTFNTANRTITRTTGSFLTDGFVPGEQITVAGTQYNNGLFVIQSVTDTVITLVSTSIVVNETSTTARVIGVTGRLTDTTVTGLGMGAGIVYRGLSNANVYLGLGADNFAINEINPPTLTVVDGGISKPVGTPGVITPIDTVAATFAQDFNGNLQLVNFEKGTVDVARDFNGFMTARMPGDLQQVHVGRTLTSTGILHATGTLDKLYVGKNLDGKVFVDHNLNLMVIGTFVNNGIPGDVTGLVQVLGDFSTGFVYGSLSGTMTVGGNLTSILKIYGNLSGQFAVTGNVAELSVLTNQSGRFNVGGSVTDYEVGSLTTTGTTGIGGDLGTFQSGNGLYGQLVIGGNLTTARVTGPLAGVLAVGIDFGNFVPGTNEVARNGLLLVTGNLSGHLVVMGNLIADTWVKGDVTGEVAVHGRTATASMGGHHTGMLGNFRIDGNLGGKIVSDGVIGDLQSNSQTLLTAGSLNGGILAAQGDINIGNNPVTGATPVLTNLQYFPGATGPNAAAIDAIFTDHGNLLFVDPTVQGLANLALILADMDALHVQGGQLTGPIP